MSIEEGLKQTGQTTVCGGDQRGPQMEAEGQQLVCDRHVMLRHIRGDGYQVYTEFDGDCSQCTRQYGAKGGTTMVIAGATVLVEGIFLRLHRVVPGMRIELRTKLHGGAGDLQTLAALAVLMVQKYNT